MFHSLLAQIPGVGEAGSNTILYVILGVAALGLVGVIFMMIKRNKG